MAAPSPFASLPRSSSCAIGSRSLAGSTPPRQSTFPRSRSIEDGKSIEGGTRGRIVGLLSGCPRFAPYGGALCGVRQRFDDGGVYLSVGFYVPPRFTQVWRDTIDIGPLQLFVEVDGVDDDAYGGFAQIMAAE